MVSESLSSSEGSGDGNAPAPLYTYSEKFYELFPQYLAIGMTESQYWDGDCQLVKAYRKADEIRMQRENEKLWLQGAYIYDAILRTVPVLHAFSKKGAKPIPYLEQPYSLSETDEKRKQEKEEKAIHDKGKALMEGFMTQFNKKFEGK